MRTLLRRGWLCGALSAALLVLPFPVAGPTPYWRTFFAWLAFVPLLSAVTAAENLGRPRPLLRGAVAAYVMGVLWYAGNCYWIYQTMLFYGGLPQLVSLGILALFCLILGLYFAAFGLFLALIAKRASGPGRALLAAPFLWVALELLSSRLTQVPWDLLGYSQIDNFLLTALAPITGVYGLSFVLMAVNALLAYGIVGATGRRRLGAIAGAFALALLLQNGYRLAPPPAPVQVTAVLVQPNLNVNEDNIWSPPEYTEHVETMMALSDRLCTPYLKGMPELDAHWVAPHCPAQAPAPGLIAWPESPARFFSLDPRFVKALQTVAVGEHAPVVAGNIGLTRNNASLDHYNSALFVAAGGNTLGRYDKVHLVPWGEYVPFKQFFAFANNLTQQAGDLTHGRRRMVFSSGGHSFGVFICYEEIFGNEIRVFVQRGAQVLVNLSDDGWYGDTSAPWQTLNMARMRAVENRRWVLRDTNTGVTTVIDPYGRLTASVPRHALTSLAARYGYRSDLTFYTRHGDLFGELCGIISMLLLVGTLFSSLRRRKA